MFVHERGISFSLLNEYAQDCAYFINREECNTTRSDAGEEKKVTLALKEILIVFLLP